MLEIGQFTDDEVDILKFVAIAAGHLTDGLKQTMIVLCEILTEEPEGGSAMIPFSTFCDLYTFLANIDCGPPSPHEPTPEEEVGEEKEDSEIKDQELSEEESKVGPDQDSELAEDEQEAGNKARFETSEVADLNEDESLDLQSDATTSENIKSISVSSSSEQQPEEVAKDYYQEEHKELSPGSSEIVDNEEKLTEGKESRLEREETGHPVENVAEREESTLTAPQQDTVETIETTEETDKEDLTTEETDKNYQTNEEINQDDQTNEETDNDVLTVNKEAATDVTESVSEKSEGGVQSAAASTVKEEKSSEIVAAEAVNDIVCRGAVATAATEAKIAAAEFVMKLQAGARKPKRKWAPHETHKKEKPRPVHYEVLGIGPPVSDEQIDKVITYMHYWSARQEGMVMPRNICHFLCPPLDAPKPTESAEVPEEKCKCKDENTNCSQCTCEQVMF